MGITARRNIRIGNSGSNTKWITLPRGFTHVSNRPINRQHRGWRDRFVTTVRGNRVAVRRTDYRGGWGQQLVLQAYRYSTVCTRYSAPKKTCRNVPYTKTHYKTKVYIKTLYRRVAYMKKAYKTVRSYKWRTKYTTAWKVYKRRVPAKKWAFKRVPAWKWEKKWVWVGGKKPKGKKKTPKRKKVLKRFKVKFNKKVKYMKTWMQKVPYKKATKVAKKYKAWYTTKVPYSKKYTKKTPYKKRYNRKVCSAAKKVCTRRGTSRINIRVGSSRGHTKVITLSRNINSQYRVYAKPVNRQHRGWKDRFIVTRRGNRIWVRRLDRNHGWGQQLILQARKTTCTRYSAPKRRCTRKSRRITARRNIRIGNSGSNTKWITLPSGFTH